MGPREDGGGRALLLTLAALCVPIYALGAVDSFASHSVSCPQVTSPPGAVYLSSEPLEATFNGNNFGINGNDVRFTDGLPGAQPPIFGIGVRTEEAAQEI